MCWALLSGICKLKDKLDPVTASKSLQFKGQGEKNVSIKGSNPREGVVCTIREHGGEWRRETSPPAGGSQAGNGRTQRAPLKREGPGGIEKQCGSDIRDLSMSGCGRQARRMGQMNQSAFVFSFGEPSITDSRWTTAILSFPKDGSLCSGRKSQICLTKCT